MKERVVITGMGAVTPVGIGVGEYWSGLISGRCGVGKIARFDPDGLPCQIGAEVKGFIPEKYLSKKLIKQTDKFMQYAIASMQMAIRDSKLSFEVEDPYRIGIVLGTSIGGIASVAEAQDKMSRTGTTRISPHFIPKMLGNIAATHIAMEYGLKGPNLTISTACASGGDAVGVASQLLELGEADIVIVTGAESLFCRLVIAGLYAARAVSTYNNEPERACRPFDRRRNGMILGEGAGTVILETLSHALRRGGPVLAELIGYANFGEGYHPTAPSPDGSGEIRCMLRAIEKALIRPDDIDYINAHGTSTILGDKVETLAIKAVFGSRAYKVPVSSTKGATGHLMGAGGITELIACVKAIQEGIVPPTINYEEQDPECDLDYVPNQARRVKVRVAMSNSFGFGGQNACLIVKKYEE